MLRVVISGGSRAGTTAWVLGAVATVACLAVLPSRAAAADRQPCAAVAQEHGLDFWLGEWAVSDGEQPGHARSDVSLELGKCLIVEHWSDATGHRGENLFGYNLDSKTWNGMFADNRGRIHIFDRGTVAAGKAQLYGRSQATDGAAVLNRITLVRMRAGNVEQTWEQSTDDGTTWTTVFRGEYSRVNP
ncbi:MAG TPA: hypothetical protein VGG63_10735 [Steroidobacteraceae bacterium]